MFVAALHVALVIAFTTRLLLRDAIAPTTRVAWFMVIAILPVFGSVLYVLFGEVNTSTRIRQRDAKLQHAIATRSSAIVGDMRAGPDEIEPRFSPAFAFCSSINGFDTVRGNRAKLMPDGRGGWVQAIADIDAAQESVHLLTFIWLTDDTGTQMARAVIRAVGRGVTCRVIVDAVGSRKLIRSHLWREMREAGVNAAVARPLGNPFYTIAKSRLDLRNHRKIVVIDGRIAYVGSQNFADPDFRVKARFAPWVDILVRVEGPVVRQGQLLFASDWVSVCGGSLEEIDTGGAPVADGFCAQMMGDGPTTRSLATPNLVAALLHASATRVTITPPYFVPDAILVEAICAAADRGVTVSLILPKKNDSLIVAAAARASYKKLLDAGVIIHEFRDGLLHAKTLTIDSKVSFIGSSNLDLRSFDLNDENNLLLYDPDVTWQIEMRQKDFALASDIVTLDEVHRWSYGRRIWNNAIATLGPVL